MEKNIVYLENGEWYDGSQMTYEEYLMITEALEEEENNPDDLMTLEEGFAEIWRMFDEKVRNHDAKVLSAGRAEYS
ncbi:MAG: hypothetical protein FWB74_04955 [Defluviitaleaceae bacterium]|nr:hypothetical protein [Defluviitaleaceae bacterium]